MYLKYICILIIVLSTLYSFFQLKPREQYQNNTKIAYITAIYGSYEATCKPFAAQTIPSDFICFTDNPSIVGNGWQIDTTPYHIQNPSRLDSTSLVNSFSNNKHTFNIAKYYKQAFYNIPRLQHYDVIIWLDGTIEITNPKTSEFIMDSIKQKKNILVFEHEESFGRLEDEVKHSHIFKYMSTNWNNQDQPYQDVDAQFASYVSEGYSDTFWKNIFPNQPNSGVWITCFVAFDMKNSQTVKLLDTWYLQTLKYTTQDQIGFPYALWKSNTIPYSLTSLEPHVKTDYYIKHNHGK